jgi:pyruvate-ferredoxin/flavodoxin oxidoreductase
MPPVDAGLDAVVEVKIPAAWATAEDVPVEKKPVPDFIRNVVEVMNAQEGDKLPVSASRAVKMVRSRRARASMRNV